MVHTRSRQEIEKIRASCRIVAETLVMLAEHIRPGVTSLELDGLAERFIRGQKAELGFKGLYGCPATLLVSVEDAVVHGLPGDDPLMEGQIVSLDVGALKDGYYGDHARTFMVGTVDEDRERLVTVTRECLDLGIQAAAAGHHIGDIGHAVQGHAEKAGFGVVRDLVGHGIGTKLHEDPQVPNYGRPGEGPALREGMCLAIEPMITMGSNEVFTQEDRWTVSTSDGLPSAHFEHTIAITVNGPEVLTAYEA